MPHEATQNLSTWEQEFLRPGIYHGHEVTRDDLVAFANNTNSLIGRGVSVPVFTKHKPPGAPDGGPVILDAMPHEQIDALDNVGWLQGVRVDDDGRAYHQIQINRPEVRDAIDRGEIKFTSPELALNYRDHEGNAIGKVIRHVALTPTPRNPVQGPFIAMSEPYDSEELVCVQFGLENLQRKKKPSSDDLEEDNTGVDDYDDEGETYRDDQAMETANPQVRTDAKGIAKQVLADLEAAGIAAPRGCDPLQDPLGFLSQLSTALRQKVMTQAEADAKKESEGDMSVSEESISQYSDQQLVQFSESHEDPAFRGMAKQLLAVRQKAAADRTASNRDKLRGAIQKAPIAKFARARLSSLVDAVQFSEDGSDEPSMRVSEVLDLLVQSTPEHLQFSETDVIDGDPSVDDFMRDGDAAMDLKQANEIADELIGKTYSGARDEQIQLAGHDIGYSGGQQQAKSGRRR